ncbi:hypothetical protein BJY52DRAFT_1193854 [Lactarius psammicola]|nr:hypothetical protein BJY52DRAFT_1193854 [Lactarius psammicola]
MSSQSSHLVYNYELTRPPSPRTPSEAPFAPSPPPLEQPSHIPSVESEDHELRAQAARHVAALQILEQANENLSPDAPMPAGFLSPRTTYNALSSAGDQADAPTLRCIAMGLARATQHFKDVSDQCGWTNALLQATINHFEANVRAGRPDAPTPPDTPLNFECNIGQCEGVVIPSSIRGGFAPPLFVQRGTLDQATVLGTMGGHDDPMYSSELFTRAPAGTPLEAEPMPVWFAEACNMRDWGLAAELARFRRCHLDLLRLDDHIKNLCDERDCTERQCRESRWRLKDARAPQRLGHLSTRVESYLSPYPIFMPRRVNLRDMPTRRGN